MDHQVFGGVNLKKNPTSIDRVGIYFNTTAGDEIPGVMHFTMKGRVTVKRGIPLIPLIRLIRVISTYRQTGVSYLFLAE
ncbi:MAG: hypothetical protein COW63_15770 [Bacteroidetes bacterium CG18_big_fil_WC_8_21_14_2_50_41_14]|nr:MAG: hypothetical protein COW63_15770 [Bacteroidetes bacterium CG18_big_fil_WC_8_21_14_2_50_41_14]PIY30498.1 MAG: hypothetical protein COZ08_12545 [Bacteroidetes bacterium CG_4_10_14_3_um_filter_42_6]PJB56719.1 MAG: hypothetical protein CO098_13230 [Bacteroidetes bacterium CG_4_9_14_3_um_filter_41_19]